MRHRRTQCLPNAGACWGPCGGSRTLPLPGWRMAGAVFGTAARQHVLLSFSLRPEKYDGHVSVPAAPEAEVLPAAVVALPLRARRCSEE